jgi:hypothetical protein
MAIIPLEPANVTPHVSEHRFPHWQTSPIMLMNIARSVGDVIPPADETHAPCQRTAPATPPERYPRARAVSGDIAARRRAMGSDPASTRQSDAMDDPRGLTPLTTRREKGV